MRRLLLVGAAAGLLCGCGAFSNRPEETLALIVEGSGADEASAAQAARRAAVSSLFELYLSTPTRESRAQVLETRILSRAKEFVSREKRLGRERGAGGVKLRMRAWVEAAALGRALEGEGLVRPDGVRGRPTVAVIVKQGAPAAQSLSRELEARGYRVIGALGPSADASLQLSASASELKDERLQGLYGAQARLEGTLTGLAAPVPMQAQASAFDVTPEGALERALENAGLIAAEAARRRLSERFLERAELIVLVENMGKPGQLLAFIRTLRAQPAISGAALGAVLDGDAKVRVFAERTTADELAARLMQLKPYALTIKSVDTGAGIVEVSEGGIAPDSPFAPGSLP